MRAGEIGDGIEETVWR